MSYFKWQWHKDCWIGKQGPRLVHQVHGSVDVFCGFPHKFNKVCVNLFHCSFRQDRWCSSLLIIRISLPKQQHNNWGKLCFLWLYRVFDAFKLNFSRVMPIFGISNRSQCRNFTYTIVVWGTYFTCSNTTFHCVCLAIYRQKCLVDGTSKVKYLPVLKCFFSLSNLSYKVSTSWITFLHWMVYASKGILSFKVRITDGCICYIFENCFEQQVKKSFFFLRWNHVWKSSRTAGTCSFTNIPQWKPG